jgi:hypothetical protein
LARSRRRRRGPRPAGATTTRQGRRRETDAQAAQETRLRARCACDGQAALLRRGKVRNRIVGSPRPGLTREQSGREFAPADTTARVARCSVSNRPDQPNASCPFTPSSKTLSTSSAISHPAARSASFETKRSGRGKLLPRPEPELGLRILVRPNSVRVTAPREHLV